MSNPYRNSGSYKRHKGIFIQPNSPRSPKAKSVPNVIKPKLNIYSYILCILYVKRMKNSYKKRRHRQKILQQWYETQQSYHLDLSITLNFIKIPMEQANIINQQEAQTLFPQIYSMIKLSQMMLEVLQKAKKPPYKYLAAKQISKFVMHYKAYGKYFSQHSKKLQIFGNLLEKHEVKLKQIEIKMQTQLSKKQSNKQFMTIKDCMDQPLYRLFKYVILLKQYIKKMLHFNPDYQHAIQCLNSFHEINNMNNQLMKKIQQKKKLIKLRKLFTNIVDQDRQLIAQMEANTTNCAVKLYIFSNMIVVTKIQSLLGSQIQQKFGILQFDQFGYIADQDDLKYFKNIVIIVSKFKCLHLFFAYEDTKTQFLKIMDKTVKNIRSRQYQWKKSLSTSLNLKKKVSQPQSNSFKEVQQRPRLVNFHPQFVVEICGFQVRPLGTITNDTVYEARFMIPYYYQDEINLSQQQSHIYKKQMPLNYKNRLSNTTSFQSTQCSHIQQQQEKKKFKNRNLSLNQKIQIHFSVLQQMHHFMQAHCSQHIPEIDLTNKDVNIYSTGTRKTKTFQVRKFLIQEFFNFVLRNTQIMGNPNWVVEKLRISEDIWNYTARRNAQSKSNDSIKSYGVDHCIVCSNAKIKSIQQFQELRQHYVSAMVNRQLKQVKQTEMYCMNFFNLLRQRLMTLNNNSFNTMQRIATYYHYKQGRIDYPFVMHHRYEKVLKSIRIYLTSVNQEYVEVIVDSRTTVGQVLDELGVTLQLQNSFEFDLIATYAQKSRLLDRDEYMVDLIKVLELKFQQYKIKNSNLKKVSRNTIIDAIKSFGTQIFQSSHQQNKIYILKTIYFTKTLQLKSYLTNNRKKELEIQKIFWTVKKGIVKLPIGQFIQLLSLYYCLKQHSQILNKHAIKVSTKKIGKMMPDHLSHVFQYEEDFMKEVVLAIQRQSQHIIHHKQNSLQKLQDKIIEISYKNQLLHTYFIEVQPKQVPTGWLSSPQLPETCLIGINHSNLIMAKSQPNTVILAQLPIQQLEFSLSVFSIFITCENLNFRFDGKMLYHFGQLIKKYQTLNRIFPQLIG